MRKFSSLPYRRFIIDFPDALSHFFVCSRNFCYYATFFCLANHVTGLFPYITPPLVIAWNLKKCNIIVCLNPALWRLWNGLMPFPLNESENVYPHFLELFRKFLCRANIFFVFSWVMGYSEKDFLINRQTFDLFFYVQYLLQRFVVWTSVVNCSSLEKPFWMNF